MFFVFYCNYKESENITFLKMEFTVRSIARISALKIKVSFRRCFFFIFLLNTAAHPVAFSYFDSSMKMNECLG